MTTIDSENHRSIAQVNRMVRSIVEAETLEQFFWVGGRIDRYYKSDFGHIYFDLVDDRSRIRCMLREERASHIPFELANHRDIEVYGDIHFYEDRAEAQINVLELRIADESTSAEPAIERLRSEGLYPPTKAPPPAKIRRIGIVTSRSSRAIGDFESAYQSAGERRVLAPVVWKYVMLEGERATQMIVDAIASVDQDPSIDVLAIIRGGGRSENLAVFDTYEIAKAVIQCKKYFVSGIGHHRDKSLADDAADYAASTPTAVAHHLADLCLRPKPSMPATRPNHRGFPDDRSTARPKPASAQLQSLADDPMSQEQRSSTAATSRVSNALVVLLLVAAIASVAFLLAALNAQLP